MTEEQPVFPGRAGRLPIKQERTERRDAGARPDHDDRCCWILRQRETVCLLNIDLNLIAGLDPLGQECRSQSEALALAHQVPHAIHRQR